MLRFQSFIISFKLEYGFYTNRTLIMKWKGEEVLFISHNLKLVLFVPFGYLVSFL